MHVSFHLTFIFSYSILKMAKSKKKRQQDFQKVKLKVGKKLPKGDNVTNLSFKTRQIKLTQRIKVDDGQKPLTRNKLSLQV